MEKSQTFIPDTAEEVMARKIPTATKSDTVGQVLTLLASDSWDDIETVFIITEEEGLIGHVSVHKLLISQKSEKIEHLMQRIKLKVGPHLDQERLVIDAIHKDVTTVPVVDHENRLIGAVTSDKIIDILHDEHLEDLLHASGIHGKIAHTSDLITARLRQVVLLRLPWLLVGLVVGVAGSFIISGFEKFLNENVSLAFFISMIAYMSDAIGTQSETLFIRAITVSKFNISRYLLRELAVGIIIGAIVGVVAAGAAFIISQSLQISLAVGVSLLLSMSIATFLACIVPLGLKALGRDPAIGSGPFATALQDLLSISIYFVIALVILRGV